MKRCKVDGCYFPVFGGGFCQRHQWKRTDKKKKETVIGKNKTKTQSFDFGFDNQIDMFLWCWENAKDKNGIVTCPYTKSRLNGFYGTEKWYSCFAHVLPKGKYTYWKLNPANIRVVNPSFHEIIDRGTSLDRINYPNWLFDKWDNEVEELKIQYDLFKKMNLLA